jgi:hypothetical protein
LDFSGIPGYLDNYEDWRGEIPRFHGLNDSPISHVTSFIDVVSKLNIVHEDVKMKMFIMALDFLEDGIFLLVWKNWWWIVNRRSIYRSARLPRNQNTTFLLL